MNILQYSEYNGYFMTRNPIYLNESLALSLESWLLYNSGLGASLDFWPGLLLFKVSRNMIFLPGDSACSPQLLNWWLEIFLETNINSGLSDLRSYHGYRINYQFSQELITDLKCRTFIIHIIPTHFTPCSPVGDRSPFLSRWSDLCLLSLSSWRGCRGHLDIVCLHVITTYNITILYCYIYNNILLYRQ